MLNKKVFYNSEIELLTAGKMSRPDPNGTGDTGLTFREELALAIAGGLAANPNIAQVVGDFGSTAVMLADDVIRSLHDSDLVPELYKKQEEEYRL